MNRAVPTPPEPLDTGKKIRPVTPRHAASLIILRGDGDETEVLMGRRAAKHRFMPNVYVFPGGRVDAKDFTAPHHTDMRPGLADKLSSRWPARMSRALAMAAIRETHEETGLRFGEIHDGVLHPDLSSIDYHGRAITPPVSPIRFHARFFVARAEDAQGDIADSAELLNLTWFPLREALAMPLVDVTDFMLQVVERRTRGQPVPGNPFFRYFKGAPKIRYE